MKKFLLPILFLLLALPAMSQVQLTVSGLITDTANGNPVPNHAVTISNDSTGGWVYYQTVYTNSNGYYYDTVPVPLNTQGYLYVSTLDCQNYSHQETVYFSPVNTTFIVNFSICTSYNPCDAAFTYQQSQPLTVQFTDASVGGDSIRQWIFGDGATSTLANPVHQYAQPGYYTVKLYIGANGTNCTDVDIQYIYVWDSTGGGCQAAFTYSIDSANTINYLHFYDQSAGNIIYWSWNFGDPASGSTNVSTVQNPTHAFSASGTYLVCLTIQGADSSCFDMTCDTIMIGYDPGCQAYFAYSYDSLQGSNLVNFTDLSTGNPTSWMWSFGDGTPPSTSQNPQHIFPAPGSYAVCLTITGDSCTSTYCKTVVITDTTNYNTVYGQVIALNSPIGSGMVMIFSLDSNQNYNPYVAVSIVDSMGYYYFSSVPDGNYYIYAIPIVPENYLPTYYGDVLTWQTATLVVLGQPNNPYNINVIAAGDMIPGNGNINGQVNTGGLKSTSLDKVTMLLMDSEGTAIAYYKLDVQGDFNFPQLSFGTYYLRAEIAGVTSDLVTVILSEENPTATVNMTFTGNKVLGIKDETSTVTSWSLYPNPVIDNLTVSLEMKEYTQAEVSIYNLTGQKSWSGSETLNAGTNRIVIPMASFRPGMYYLRIKSANGLQLTAKFLLTN